MYRLSDNYYHRKCYIERKQVPTQTVMKNIMGPLAPVYFKSMSRELKLLAGFEPLLHGAGTEWCMPPEEILAGRHVLKPVNIKELKNLRFEGIMKIGELYRLRYFRHTVLAINQALVDSNKKWMDYILQSNIDHYGVCQKEEAANNAQKLRLALQQFELLHRQSVTKVEEMVLAAATKELERVRSEIFQHMKNHYAKLLDYQARTLYDHYEKTLNEDKETTKQQFIRDVTNIRTDMGNKIHNITNEKHISVEKLRQFLMCKTLACQVYVALKEREACEKENEIAEKEHRKKIKVLQDDIAMKDFELRLSIEQRQKRQFIIRIWKQKLCHIVKRFQTFVQYCLVQLPEQAAFFLDLEKLMLLQISKVLDDPLSPSIIETESGFEPPQPRPHPFYLFCDKGYKPELDRNLCPIHCTSSAPEMPVIVINKRCFYTACNNFEKFTDKLTTYLCGHKGDDDDVFEDHNYEEDFPVKITSSQQLLEMKLESSIMQILQQELPNVRELPIECGSCKLPYCFCSPRLKLPKHFVSQYPVSQELPALKKNSGSKIETRGEELKLEREPKWESYFKFVEPKRCKCAIKAKKHLVEHLPSYMWRMSPYAPPELPNYERCKLLNLKKMVKKARGSVTPPPPPPKEPSKTKTVGVQYSDTDFDHLCICLSDDELVKLFEKLEKTISQFSLDAKEAKCDVVGASVVSRSYLEKLPGSFATSRAYSLRRLMSEKPSIDDIFRASDCKNYDDKSDI